MARGKKASIAPARPDKAELTLDAKAGKPSSDGTSHGMRFSVKRESTNETDGSMGAVMVGAIVNVDIVAGQEDPRQGTMFDAGKAHRFLAAECKQVTLAPKTFQFRLEFDGGLNTLKALLAYGRRDVRLSITRVGTIQGDTGDEDADVDADDDDVDEDAA